MADTVTKKPKVAKTVEEGDAKDAAFLIGCIKAAVEGKILINLEEAAVNVGMTNVGSVRNKLAGINKKFGIQITATKKTRATIAADTADGEPAAEIAKPSKSKKRVAADISEEEEQVVEATKVTKAPKATKAKANKKKKVAEENNVEFPNLLEEEA